MLDVLEMVIVIPTLPIWIEWELQLVVIRVPVTLIGEKKSGVQIKTKENKFFEEKEVYFFLSEHLVFLFISSLSL